MRFTREQYVQACANLALAQLQLEPDGRCCTVCGDGGHQAWECGHNPLVAVAMCQQIAQGSEALHELLHRLAGYEQSFGVQLGPARVVMPEPETEPGH